MNRDRPKRAALHAYELGRARRAARATWVVAPAVALCALETGVGETCACLGVVLPAAAVYLRWRDRRRAESVTAGLLAGGVSLAAGLAVACPTPGWVWVPALWFCATVCLFVGLWAGLGLGARAARGQFGLVGWLTAAGVALLAAGLGCVGLGAGGVLGAGVGLVLGSLPAALAKRAA